MVNATPRSLYPRERDPVTIVQEAGWAPGPIWTGTENLAPHRDSIPDRPVRSESLYPLPYPGAVPPSGKHCHLTVTSTDGVPSQKARFFRDISFGHFV